MSVLSVLSEAGRTWHGRPGASAAEVARLVAASPCEIPPTLVELLLVSNGGGGELGSAPRLFMLDTVEDIIAGLGDSYLREAFPGFLFFGDNGGLERIALDFRREHAPYPVVMIDPVAGPDSAKLIAPDVGAFVASIGLVYDGREQDDA